MIGDSNDPFRASDMLPEAGYTSCFTDLGPQSPPTSPAMPMPANGGHRPQLNVCFDAITVSGPARATAAQWPRLFDDDIAPSDHWPMLAFYDLDAAIG